MILFDTNILVYSRNTDDPRNTVCANLLLRSDRDEIKAAVSTQNIVEFTAVLEKLRVMYGRLTKSEIVEYAENLQSGYLKIIYPNRDTLTIFNTLLTETKSLGNRKVFDTFIAATMLSNDIYQIVTYNKNDFTRFKQIEVLSPEEI